LVNAEETKTRRTRRLKDNVFLVSNKQSKEDFKKKKKKMRARQQEETIKNTYVIMPPCWRITSVTQLQN